MRWKEFMISYMPTFLLYIGIVSFIALPEYSYINAFLQAIFIFFYSYITHRFAHELFKDKLAILNPHIYVHHKKSIKMPYFVDLALDSLVELSMFCSLLVFDWYFETTIFSPRLVVCMAFVYIFVHVYEYSIKGSHYHALHHKHSFCNYDPEIVDALFGTLCEPDAPYTPMYRLFPPIIPAGILAFIFTSDSVTNYVSEKIDLPAILAMFSKDTSAQASASASASASALASE